MACNAINLMQGETVKGNKTKEQKAEEALELWAAARLAEAHNGNLWPSPETVLEPVSEPGTIQGQEAVFDRSDQTYDGTQFKYEHHVRPAHATLSAIEAVERALDKVGRPDILVRVLEALYPAAGRFERRISSEADAIRKFKADDIFGVWGHYRIERAQGALVQIMVREFRRVLWREL